jgi:hypothetical protein
LEERFTGPLVDTSAKPGPAPPLHPRLLDFFRWSLCGLSCFEDHLRLLIVTGGSVSRSEMQISTVSFCPSSTCTAFGFFTEAIGLTGFGCRARQSLSWLLADGSCSPRLLHVFLSAHSVGFASSLPQKQYMSVRSESIPC